MDGLGHKIRPVRDRYKHIVENMIHQCDLTPSVLLVNLMVLEPFDGTVDVKMHVGSFLELKDIKTKDGKTKMAPTGRIDPEFKEAMKSWGVDKFDVVIGNPPYTIGGKANLYHQFVSVGHELLADGGC